VTGAVERRRASPPWSPLVDASALVTIEAIAGAIPDVARCFGFECRLHPDARAVDFGVGIARPSAGALALPTAALTADDAWRRVRIFARQWARPGTLTHERVPFIFLEFDADGAAPLLPVPSVFVSFDWPLSDGGPSSSPPAAWTVAEESLELLLEARLTARLRERLEVCFAALPEDGRVVHAGAMLGRRSDTARLSVSVPRVELGGYLARIGWHHSTATIDDCIAAYAPNSTHAHLECDVGDVLAPRLGIVIAVDHPGEWVPILHRLSDDGLCARAKRDAVLAWAEISVGEPVAPPSPGRGLSHVKIDCEPGRAPAAKVYLTFTLGA